MSGGLYDDYAQLARDVRETRRKLDEASAIAYSDDGLVSVTVSGRGELLTLALDPRIYRGTDSAALASTIKDTLAEAVESARRQAFEHCRPFLPSTARVDSTDVVFDPFLHQLDRQMNGDPT
ncbi:YbaB/EbfC family nucleoid-associated protein [Actinokineospora sp.]|uniref:YbaB/EbfC family nucleoid-associated protein n=1 Tax=Actinokineospora sp. TaxID=1872133 RepID=UPI0040378EE7